MSREERDYDDFSIVPEQDDLESHRTRTDKKGANAPPGGETVRIPTSGAVRFLLAVFFLALCATGGGAYYFYEQSRQMLVELNDAGARIGQLESRLQLVNQAVELSSSDLLESVQFNLEEINKLVRASEVLTVDVDRIRTEIEAQESNLAAAEAAVDSQDELIEQQIRNLEQNTILLGSIRESIVGIRRDMPDGDLLDRQLASINDDLEVLKSSISTQEVDLVSRVGLNEERLDAIDSYRLQTTQDLSAIREAIGELQEIIARRY